MREPKNQDLLVEFRQAVLDFQGDYEASKVFSAEWDRRLGFQKEETERKLLEQSLTRAAHQEQPWIGLPLASLETPYPELLQALP